MFHKGLTFPKRSSPLKLLKDLYGIWYVSTQLGIFSETALIEFKELTLTHTAWSKTLTKNLKNWRENAAPIDWSKLEAQDPSGRLKKLNFQRVLDKLHQ